MGRSWDEIPLPLRIVVVLDLATLPWLIAASWNHARLVVFLVAFFVLINVLLLRGSRVVWVFLVGSEVVGWALVPWIGWGSWWGAALGIVQTALLVWPSSVRYIWRPRRRPPASSPPGQESPAGSAQPDAGRPDGWYADFENPSRMRYWHGASGEWLGRAKTPRKLKGQLPEESVAPAQATAPAQAPGGAEAQSTWDPRAQSDCDRPRGWYVDPAEPTHMRFWAGEASGWQSRARSRR